MTAPRVQLQGELRGPTVYSQSEGGVIDQSSPPGSLPVEGEFACTLGSTASVQVTTLLAPMGSSRSFRATSAVACWLL